MPARSTTSALVFESICVCLSVFVLWTETGSQLEFERKRSFVRGFSVSGNDLFVGHSLGLEQTNTGTTTFAYLRM